MFKSILVPLDGSQASEAVLPLVRDLAASTQAAVHLVRAVPDPVAASLAAFDNTLVAVPAMVPAESREEAVREAADGLKAAAAGLGEGVAAHIHAEIGAPAEVILKTLGKVGADVVVMSTHGRTALGALVMGSVAGTVVRQSEVPVMLLRPNRGIFTSAAEAASSKPRGAAPDGTP